MRAWASAIYTTLDRIGAAGNRCHEFNSVDSIVAPAVVQKWRAAPVLEALDQAKQNDVVASVILKLVAALEMGNDAFQQRYLTDAFAHEVLDAGVFVVIGPCKTQ